MTNPDPKRIAESLAGVQAVAFAQNTRDEVRLQGGDGQIVGSLAAEPGMAWMANPKPVQRSTRLTNPPQIMMVRSLRTILDLSRMMPK